MTDYWQKGYDDPQRGQVYEQLLRRMYVLTMNVYVRYCIRNSNYLTNVYNRTRASRKDWSAAALLHDMENYVSEVAMLELEPEHTRKERQTELYASHQRMMADLFDYIWTSRLWTDGVTQAFKKMLLSPTVDAVDQQLLVSAITLSLLNYFGVNKFRLLVHTYLKSGNEYVRQRALIGWVLCLPHQAQQLYTEVGDLMKEVADDERCRNELAELQMQMIYCLRTESDTQMIQRDIMPELLKNNNFRITRNGIEEVEEDPMEDVLHPELSEQRMEKLEEGIRRMVDLQKQGADIYFGGFSQMKRFSFFDSVSNWFVPFYPQHPGVSGILENIRGKKFLNAMIMNGPFCDNDKYSFIIAFERTMKQIPENLLSMLDRGEATLVGGELDGLELKSPAYIRRSYLQNLYRFFRVYPSRSEFSNPFANEDRQQYYFFASPLFQGTGLETKFGEVAAFFVKHGAYDGAKAVLNNYREEVRDAQFYMLNGHVLMRTHEAANAGLTAIENYARVLELDPENRRAWAGYARASFAAHDYRQALTYYRKLAEANEGNQNYLLNEAVCLTNMKEYDEALKILYKLNYESPDNLNVSRVLAWALVGSHKYSQAEKIYDGLIGNELTLPDDLLNAAYCHWFSGNVLKSIELFKQYAKQDRVSFDAATEFLENEAAMISDHGVSEVEVRLMMDLLI